eukprot:CAMPEP_0205832218 /NCGR_PEP_ID=MMETSP0206-20130828/46383_1 /ASSEMBLY_ACC=CAM_ASM_000279 /TAXON_ID=36767 /ORGANISM="Euplotes focardii, Strain TN1" /LENGTH=37 /DNA_ID= /DNA_START= /DNA_END= /DNA_ORIENTATION=
MRQATTAAPATATPFVPPVANHKNRKQVAPLAAIVAP